MTGIAADAWASAQRLMVCRAQHCTIGRLMSHEHCRFMCIAPVRPQEEHIPCRTKR